VRPPSVPKSGGCPLGCPLARQAEIPTPLTLLSATVLTNRGAGSPALGWAQRSRQGRGKRWLGVPSGVPSGPGGSPDWLPRANLAKGVWKVKSQDQMGRRNA
jgi:hypothetical protein